MTLQQLIARYFDLMRSTPSVDDLMRFAVVIPSHLQLSFLGWMRIRADHLESLGLVSSGSVLN